MAYDAIVVGAGHNGLAAAALLAAGGRRVVVLERGERIGGLAVSGEFHPGYRGAGLLHDSRGVHTDIVRRLDLEDHGLRLREAPPDLLSLGDGGAALLLRGQPDAAAAEIAPHSAADARRFPQFLRFVEGMRGILTDFRDLPPLDLVEPEANDPLDLLGRAARLRRLGRRRMMELLRLPPMCVADWLDEWFESGLLKAALALPAVAGTFTGPRSPGSNFNLLLRLACAEAGLVGGGPALAAALERAARARNVEIRTGSAVETIAVEAGAARGVELRDGERLDAPLVAACCDPRVTLLELLPPGTLPFRLRRHIGAFRMRGTTAQLLLALDRSPRFAARPDATVAFASTGGTLLDIERAFDAVKYRRCSARPALEIHVPTADFPQLAPAGHAVVSVLVHFAPYDLDGGWSDDARERLADAVVAMLEPQLPGLQASLVARRLLSPADIESEYGVRGGHIHHGEHALDQLLVRPAPGCSRYATPVRGLFLCGSGSHPGGGLSCIPGMLATKAILAAEVQG